jgi:hypothetical protein
LTALDGWMGKIETEGMIGSGRSALFYGWSFGEIVTLDEMMKDEPDESAICPCYTYKSYAAG